MTGDVARDWTGWNIANGKRCPHCKAESALKVLHNGVNIVTTLTLHDMHDVHSQGDLIQCLGCGEMFLAQFNAYYLRQVLDAGWTSRTKRKEARIEYAERLEARRRRRAGDQADDQAEDEDVETSEVRA